MLASRRSLVIVMQESANEKIKRVSREYQLPCKRALYSGYDLHSAQDMVIPPKTSSTVVTDHEIRMPAGMCGRIAPYTGLGLLYGINVGAGVIAEDFHGTVSVVLFNRSNKEFVVQVGDPVAQLICEKICHPELRPHDTLDDGDHQSSGT